MSYSTTSIIPTLHGPWRLGAVPSVASAASSSSGQTASARAADSPERPPLLQAMLATMTVTEADAAGASGAAADAAQAGNDPPPPLQDAVLGFSQALMQALRPGQGEAAAAGVHQEGQARYGRAEELAPRIGALAQRLDSTAADDAAKTDAAAREAWPTQQAVRRVLEAFTQLQRAMGKPFPEGAQAQREALGEFLERLAQSFHTGSSSNGSAQGALIDVKA